MRITKAAVVATLIIASVDPAFAQTARPVVTAKKNTPAESPEHAYGRNQIEKFKAEWKTLLSATGEMAKLAPILQESTLCQYAHHMDKPYWKDCILNIPVASEKAGV